jgi:predicted KAP-like P-loop ATPase
MAKHSYPVQRWVERERSKAATRLTRFAVEVSRKVPDAALAQTLIRDAEYKAEMRMQRQLRKAGVDVADVKKKNAVVRKRAHMKYP